MIAVIESAKNPSLKNSLFRLGVEVIAIVVIFISLLVVQHQMSISISYYTCDQTDVSFPMLKDTIPFYVVVMFGSIVPVVIILIVEWINGRSKTDEKWQTITINSLNSVSLFVLGIGIACFLSTIAKRWVLTCTLFDLSFLLKRAVFVMHLFYMTKQRLED